MAKKKTGPLQVTREQLVTLFRDELGAPGAASWSLKRLQEKLNAIEDYCDEDTECDDAENQALLNSLRSAVSGGLEIQITAFDEGAGDDDEEPAPKAKGKAKAAPAEEDDDEEDDDDEDDDEEDDDDEEEEEPAPKAKGKAKAAPAEEDDEEPAPKAKAKGKAKAAPAEDDEEEPAPKAKGKGKGKPPVDDDDDEEPAPKAKAKAKGKGKAADVETNEDGDELVPVTSNAKAKAKGKGKGKDGPKTPGVIASIIDLLKKASSKKPLSKQEILDVLIERFPDRAADSMLRTINVQVPNRIKVDKGITVNKNDKGYWIDE